MELDGKTTTHTQEREDERWSSLDKRIERARARPELARLGMQTIFSSYKVIFFVTNACDGHT